MPKSQYRSIGCCVNLSGLAIQKMMDKAVSVELETVRRNIGGEAVNEFARNMGYSIGPERGLHLKDDYLVSYYRSEYKGRKCYIIRHSSIEYVWTLDT